MIEETEPAAPSAKILDCVPPDARMRPVWRVLQAQSVTQAAIEAIDSLHQLRTWDIPDYDVSLRDQGCAAFFAGIVIEFGIPKNASTARNVLALVKPWRDAAEQCQIALDFPGRRATDPELALALSMVADFFQGPCLVCGAGAQKEPLFLGTQQPAAE
jgi:hypothetical protein